MQLNYKIKGNDIGDILETFTSTETSTYKIPRSKFTDGDNDYKKTGSDLSVVTNIPTSAGAGYIGGAYTVPQYKKAGNSIDAALKGRRPVGKLILTLNAADASGYYTIYRQNGALYYVAGQNVTTGGTRICADHNPQYIHIEMQGPGCGGGGSALTTGGQGGSAGAYFFVSLKADKIIIKNSISMRGGGKDENAPQPADSAIWFDYKDKTYKLTAAHGRGGTRGTIGSEGGMVDNRNSQKHTLRAKFSYGSKPYDGVYDGGSYPGEELFIEQPDGTINGLNDKNWVNNFNNQFPDGEVKLLWASEGGWGLARDGEDKRYTLMNNSWTEYFNRPESYGFNRGGTTDGFVDTWKYGGGGGPSVLASGGKAVKKSDGSPGTLGSGGAGGAWDNFTKQRGGAGGNGIVYIYY